MDRHTKWSTRRHTKGESQHCTYFGLVFFFIVSLSQPPFDHEFSCSWIQESWFFIHCLVADLVFGEFNLPLSPHVWCCCSCCGIRGTTWSVLVWYSFSCSPTFCEGKILECGTIVISCTDSFSNKLHGFLYWILPVSMRIVKWLLEEFYDW